MAKKSIKRRIGRCFELNYKYVQENEDYSLVHGYITDLRKHPPVTIPHAWSKKDSVVYDAVLDEEMDAEVYKYFFQAEEKYTYSACEALQASMSDKTYGNWEEL